MLSANRFPDCMASVSWFMRRVSRVIGAVIVPGTSQVGGFRELVIGLVGNPFQTVREGEIIARGHEFSRYRLHVIFEIFDCTAGNKFATLGVPVSGLHLSPNAI